MKSALFFKLKCQTMALCALPLFGGSHLALAAAPQRNTLNFDYNVDLGFIFFDAISSDSFSQVIAQDSEAAEPRDRGYRTLGLRHSSFQFDWRHVSDGYLRLKLRPDAGLRRLPDEPDRSRELDTRAGRTHRPAPPIEILDSYEIGLSPGDQFRWGLGVYDRLEPNRMAYESGLAFGLDARLPEKFAAFRMMWTVQPIETPKISPKVQDTYHYGIWVIDGRNDRRELLARGRESDDRGPSSVDPFIGGAFTIDALAREEWRINFVGGYLESRVPDGRAYEVFISLSGDLETSFFGKWTRLHVQSKWSRESWRVSDLYVPSLIQHSHSLSLRHRLNLKSDLISGIHLGVSEQHSEIDLSSRLNYFGYQLDFGLEYRLTPFLTGQLMLAGEVRDLELAGEKTGAFQLNESSQRRLNRLSFAINYQI